MTIYFSNNTFTTTVPYTVTAGSATSWHSLIKPVREQKLYAGAWKVHVTPEGKNDGKNEGGLIIRLVNGSNTQEVSRVGFIRRNSNNPDHSFKRQLELEIERAQTAADTMNNLTSKGLA